jgi:hypothetical protein
LIKNINRRGFNMIVQSIIRMSVVLVVSVVLVMGESGLAQAQMPDAVILAGLQDNGKLKDVVGILDGFNKGEPDAAVIVTLQPSAAARDMAAQSQLSVHVPAEFSNQGAPTFYNLQDRTLRKQLRATVIDTVAGAIDRLGSDGVRISQRFTYQFGFAAHVTPAALQRIVDDPNVISVEKDHILAAHLAQGIPLMNASTSRVTYGGSGLSIAICDTGIDTSHPQLGNGGAPVFNSKVIGGYDTGDNDADPRPSSTGSAHGTACAGIAAGGIGSIGDYIGGVAPDAKLYAIKISFGDTGSAYDSAMIAGWEWCVTHQDDDPANPIMIINTSFGGGKYYATCDSEVPAMTTAAANAVAAGITIFASSGNDGYCNSMAWPACISYVNSVGAVYDAALGTYGFCVDATSCAPKVADGRCSTGYIAWDSTAGDKVTSYSNAASFLTLLAPSHNAYTTDIVGAGGYTAGDYDTTFGGTSAASPYAAGAAAVLQGAAKAKSGSFLPPALVRQYLVNNGDNVTDSKVALTKPRVNLGRAVNALSPLPPSHFPWPMFVPATTAKGITP